MLDQAYEQGCEVALNELAEVFGEDVVEELVKIAKDKTTEYAATGAGAAAGGAAGGYGAYKGTKALMNKHMTLDAVRKHKAGYEKKLRGPQGKFNLKNLKGETHLGEGAIQKKLLTRGKQIAALGRHGGKVGAGVGALAGAAGLGYAAKKMAE